MESSSSEVHGGSWLRKGTAVHRKTLQGVLLSSNGPQRGKLSYGMEGFYFCPSKIEIARTSFQSCMLHVTSHSGT